MGSFMPIAIKSMAARGCLCALLLAAAACSPRRIPPMTVTDLMEDRVLLDGVLMKCNQSQKPRNDSDCVNARIASERLANRNEQAEEAKRAEEFEHRREQLRMSQEKQRQEKEAKTKVDAYHLPVVPVEPATPAPAPATGADSPIMSQSKP
jgi:hypothetical protein